MSVLRAVGYRSLSLVSSLATQRRDSQRLRILAYHGIDDPMAFRAQMEYLAMRYDIVAGPEELPRPRPPVWITFDDGEASVIEHGIPILAEVGARATMFICPGIVESGEMFWWDVVASAAGTESELVSSSIADLKRSPDRQRRAVVEAMRRELHGYTSNVATPASVSQLRRWTAAGHALGNHTWDHPILPMCGEREQRIQLMDAHAWFSANGFPTPSMFAYPNGDWSRTAEEILSDLGYSVGLLFDHKVAHLPLGLRTSRIRVNASDPRAEFAAKVSGVHPWLHHVRTTVVNRRG